MGPDRFEDGSFDRQPEISDADLTKSPKKKDPLVFAIFVAVFAVVVLLFWSGGYWLQTAVPSLMSSSDFYKVTNRQISTFIWQFPSLRRQYQSGTIGYLPGFDYTTRTGIASGQADVQVQAPKKLLYSYHAWNRLVNLKQPKRIVPMLEFYEFLDFNPEWDPVNWKEAPEAYRQLVRRLQFRSINEAEWVQAAESIPEETRVTFMGWKNATLEAPFIDEQKITVGQMQDFLEKYPHYARNYWKNLVAKDYPLYLLSVWQEKEPQEILSGGEVAGFLKQAFWNEQQALKGL